MSARVATFVSEKKKHQNASSCTHSWETNSGQVLLCQLTASGGSNWLRVSSVVISSSKSSVMVFSSQLIPLHLIHSSLKWMKKGSTGAESHVRILPSLIQEKLGHHQKHFLTSWYCFASFLPRNRHKQRMEITSSLWNQSAMNVVNHYQLKSMISARGKNHEYINLSRSEAGGRKKETVNPICLNDIQAFTENFQRSFEEKLPKTGSGRERMERKGKKPFNWL